MPASAPVPISRRRGFTTSELMVAVVIMGFVAAGIGSFLRQMSLMYYSDRARILISKDMRKFTTKLDDDAVTANYFCIYPGFSSRSVTVGSVTSDAAVADGEVGDLLVLVYTDPASTGSGTSMINRLVGYYREITNSTLNTGPVHRFDVTISPAVAASSNPMYVILNTYVTGTAASYPTIEEISQGLELNNALSTTTPALFYNRQNRSVLVSAQVSEIQAEAGTNTQTGNTYNFTVSPRG